MAGKEILRKKADTLGEYINHYFRDNGDIMDGIHEGLADIMEDRLLREIGEWLQKEVINAMRRVRDKYPEANTATVLIYVMEDLSKQLQSGTFKAEDKRGNR